MRASVCPGPSEPRASCVVELERMGKSHLAFVVGAQIRTGSDSTPGYLHSFSPSITPSFVHPPLPLSPSHPHPSTAPPPLHTPTPIHPSSHHLPPLPPPPSCPLHPQHLNPRPLLPHLPQPPPPIRTLFLQHLLSPDPDQERCRADKHCKEGVSDARYG